MADDRAAQDLQAFGFAVGSVLFTGATVVDQIIATLSYLLQWKEKEARPLLAGAFNAMGKILTGIGDTIGAIIEKLRYALNIIVGKLRIELNRPENIPDDYALPPGHQPPPPGDPLRLEHFPAGLYRIHAARG